MASARMTYTWACGDELECEVVLDASYPDALNQAKVEAMAMFREGMGMLLTTEAAEGE